MDSKKKVSYLLLLLLLIITIPLRFVNLGYSEFIPDEKKTIIRPIEGESVSDFLLRQRKGPLQFLLADIPYKITGDATNELAQRIPFAIANVLAVVALYFLVLILTKRPFAAFILSVIFSACGFTVGFGRISQYQSLNMLFSFCSLVALSLMRERNTKTRLFAALAGVFTALSFLSHWDAFFYLPIAGYLIAGYCKRIDTSAIEKKKTLFVGFLSFVALFFPFAVPYLVNTLTVNYGNISYFGTRAGLSGSSLVDHFDIFKLYNPFVTQYYYLFGLFLSLVFYKKTWPFITWFITDLLLIKFLMTTPKTHIYNYVIPLIFCAGLGFYYLLELAYLKSRTVFAVLTLPLLAVSAFLIYQSYILFVNHSPEYPWFQKNVWIFNTTPFYSDQVVTFGFPYYRAWKEVDKVIPKECYFLTNENKSIAQTYLKSSYGNSRDCLYIVTIKRPFNLDGAEVKFSNLKNSQRVYQYRNDQMAVTSVYKVK